MSHWTKENVERLTREYLGEDDGSAQAKKRARILAAATRSFMERGYRKTSVDEVARDARVAKGTVYLYFTSKADLLVHAIALEKKALMGRFEPLFVGAIPPAERLRTYLEIVFASVTDLPLVSRLMGGDAELLEALDDLGPEAMERSRSESRRWIAELIELAAPGAFSEAEREARAEIVIAVQFFAIPLLSDRARGSLSVESYRALFSRVLASGLASLSSPSRPPEPAVLPKAKKKAR